MQRLSPELSFRGFGGSEMEAAGCKLDFELTKLAVIGFVEVVPKLREFFRVADIASDVFKSNRPDAVVLVDFPGFNWHIAKRAKEEGIPVHYYLPPQLWAWGAWRIKKMKRTVDHVLCNLPFEQQWYSKRGMDVDYVGHPFFDEVAQRQLDERFTKSWSEHDGVQVAVLPGSRTREVTNIWPMQLAAIRELSARYPKTRFLVACLKDRHCLWCQKQLNSSDEKELNIEFFVGRTSEIIEIADCSLMKSGSVSLEMMARGTPSVVVYHVGRVFYAASRLLTDIKSITLPNMIAQKTIMPEFLAVGSTQKTIERAVAAMDRLIGDREERVRQRAELIDLREQFARPGASDRAARAILSNIGICRETIPMPSKEWTAAMSRTTAA